MVDNVDVPSQLFTTFIEGVPGVDFGAAMPSPGKLVQPSIVCVTVYVPGVITVTEEVVSGMLQSKYPPAVVDNVEVPSQLFTTSTTGVGGIVDGVAPSKPCSLVHPSTVCVTE